MIGSDLTTPIIAAAAVAATWLGAIFTRKGNREDNRIKEEDQAFNQLGQMADRYKKETDELRERVRQLEADRTKILDDNLERFRLQVGRCRAVNASILAAFDSWQNKPGDDAAREVADAIRALHEHNQDDHEAS